MSKYTLTTIENPSFTAVEPATFEDAKKLYNAINNPTLTIEDVINKPLDLVNVAMRSEQRTNEDGEEYTKYYTTLILATGESVECTYTRFAKSVVSILNTFGSPDTWPEPIKVIPRVVRFSGGFHETVTLDVE